MCAHTDVIGAQIQKEACIVLLSGRPLFYPGTVQQSALLTALLAETDASTGLTMLRDLLLTDLSKAFDCLVHDLLIAKLHAYGFDYLSLKLIYSYLTGRKQRVRVNAQFSEWNHLEFGVPQGSILGIIHCYIAMI